MSGILFGTRATLSPELIKALTITGTLHIVALSGMNITIMTSIIGSVLHPFISRRLAILITIVLIIMFILFVGPSPSIVRAGIMGCIGLIAISSGRQNWSLYALILAVIGMLLLHPPWIADLSFQLSVAATLGIILFGSSPVKGKTRWPIWTAIETSLRITLAAQVFTIPLIFFQFQRISLISPIANLLIGWTIAPITIAGFVVAILGFLWLPVGQVVAWVTWILLEYLVLTIRLISLVPFASVGFN